MASIRVYPYTLLRHPKSKVFEVLGKGQTIFAARIGYIKDNDAPCTVPLCRFSNGEFRDRKMLNNFLTLLRHLHFESAIGHPGHGDIAAIFQIANRFLCCVPMFALVVS